MIGIACYCKSIDMIKLLVKHGADPNILGDKNVPINDITHYWQCLSFLSWSVQVNNVKIVKLALKPEFQTTKEILNCVDRLLDETPLMMAVSRNCVDIVRVLIGAGADINVKSHTVCFICKICCYGT